MLGVVKEKRLDQLLPLFPKDAQYYFARPDIPRGLDGKSLRDVAAGYHLQGNAYPSVTEAFEASKKAAQASDLIFVGGSTFTVAEVL